VAAGAEGQAVKHPLTLLCLWAFLAIVALAATVSLAGCGAAPARPPTSLACHLPRTPAPVWYAVEESGMPACLEVVGVIVPSPEPCCPPETVCLTKGGGQALIVDRKTFTPWVQEVIDRCAPDKPRKE
jgi:hypothetical protein